MSGIQESPKNRKPVQNVEAHIGIANEERKKRCSKCGVEKVYSEFFRDSSIKCGFRSRCKACVKLYKENHRKNNLEIILVQERNQYRDNKKIIQKRRSKNRKSNLQMRFFETFKTRMQKTLNGICVADADYCRNLLGCSIDDFVEYIISKFTVDMCVECLGHNGIHLDHIKPVSSFDLNRADHREKCFHYTNFQPLWATDNRKKGAKIICQSQ